MLAKFRIIVITLFFPFILTGQSFEGGVSLGLMTYQGDLVDNFVELSETNLAYGVNLRAILTEKISVRVGFIGGTLTGNDSNSSSPGRRSRELRFSSLLNEFHVVGEWNFLGQDRSDNRGIVLRQKFTPYVFGGVGMIFFQPEVSQAGVPDPEGTDFSTFNLSIPLGAGFKIGLDERITIAVEAGSRTAFTDYLDGISLLGNPDRNDWYFVGNVMISYTFGSPQFF